LFPLIEAFTPATEPNRCLFAAFKAADAKNVGSPMSDPLMHAFLNCYTDGMPKAEEFRIWAGE
jgi:hypothetical protein